MDAQPLSLAPLGFLELDPPALIDVADEAGFTSVCLRLLPSTSGGIHYRLPTGSRALEETRARLDATGVGVLQVEVVQLGRTTDVAVLRPLLESTAALGAARLLTTGHDE